LPKIFAARKAGKKRGDQACAEFIASHTERRKLTNSTFLQQLPTFLAATKQIYLSFFNLLQFGHDYSIRHRVFGVVWLRSCPANMKARLLEAHPKNAGGQHETS